LRNRSREETDLLDLDWVERFLEWGFLSGGVPGLAVQSIGGEAVDGLTAELMRDSQYKIMASMRGRIERDAFERLLPHSRIPPSGELPFFSVVCTDGLRSVILSNCTIADSVQSLSGDPLLQVEIGLTVDSIARSTGDTETPAATTDWYLNGPAVGSFIWPRVTERRYHGRYVRTRTCTDGESLASVEYPATDDPISQSSSPDHLLVTLDNVQVIVSKVPEHLTPNWSVGLGLEFRRELGGIPDEGTRNAIAEALSFLFGRQLLYIGFTSFDSLGQPVEEWAADPWGDDVVATCRAPGWPPLGLPWEPEQSEYMLSSLIQSYVSLRNELDLSDVLWAYWVGLRMPVGFELPLLGLALERLMDAWFRSNRSKSRGVYMPLDEFEQLTEEPFLEVERRLGGLKYADRMMRRMRWAFQMGVNERFETFFEELGLALGPTEQLALKRRNRCAHGGPVDPNQLREHIRLARTYQTLVHRVLLRVLGYTGSYIDYGTLGFPEKALDECAGS
jgi:hypothetical protein